MNADPGSPDRAKAKETLPTPDSTEDLIERGMKGLLSHDFEVRASAVELLAGRGEEAATALVDVLLKRRDEPHLLSGAAEALAEIGRPALPAVLAGLERLVDLRRPVDVYLLETLADLLGQFNDRRAVEGLARQVERLRHAERTHEDHRVRECCGAARLRLRRVLFDLGDRRGAEELVSLLGDGRRRVPAGLVELLEKLGTRDALIPLARLEAIEEPVSRSGAHLIREAIRAIAHRERLRPDDPLIRKAGSTERTALERILPKLKPPG